MSRRSYLALTCLIAFLTGCGQTGALYLPDQPESAQPPAPMEIETMPGSDPAEAEEEDEEEGTP